MQITRFLTSLIPSVIWTLLWLVDYKDIGPQIFRDLLGYIMPHSGFQGLIIIGLLFGVSYQFSVIRELKSRLRGKSVRPSANMEFGDAIRFVQRQKKLGRGKSDEYVLALLKRLAVDENLTIRGIATGGQGLERTSRLSEGEFPDVIPPRFFISTFARPTTEYGYRMDVCHANSALGNSGLHGHYHSLCLNKQELDELLPNVNVFVRLSDFLLRKRSPGLPEA